MHMHRWSLRLGCLAGLTALKQLQVCIVTEGRVTSMNVVTQESGRFYSESNITKNIKIFLQLFLISPDLLTCHQELVRVGCYYTVLT